MMAREILYRRSFHCVRDLQAMDNMFGLDEALVGTKSGADWKLPISEGGFEAPRNSLDVPSRVGEISRRSEARFEDIPIGYELSRSLTSRRKPEVSRLYDSPTVLAAEHQPNVGTTTKMVPHQFESDQQTRTPSVVARLMGLEPMPQDAPSIEFSKRLSGERVNSNRSSRRSLLQDFSSSQDERTLSNQATVSSDREISIPRSDADDDKKLRYVELPFRNHPQEKQLQEFKKEFAARQALLCRNRQLSDRDLNLESSISGEKLADALPCAKQLSGSESLNESKEFQDALEFLHSNKEFFVKVLNDPTSLFAKHLQRVSPSAKEALQQKTDSHLKGNRLVRSFPGQPKDSPISPSNVKGFPEVRRRQNAGQFELKVQGEWTLDWQASRFRPNEEMPNRYQRRRTSSSPTGLIAPKRGETACYQMPTRIVVLKPNPDKPSNAKARSPSMLRPNVSFNVRAIAKENAKTLFPDAKEKAREDASKKHLLAGKGRSADPQKDPRNIAREIVKQAKEDMTKTLLKERSRTWESSSFTRSSGTGRRLSSQGTDFQSDPSGISDGEGYCTPSKRIARDNAKTYSSLPSSPRLHQRCVEDENRAFCFSDRKSAQAHTYGSKHSSFRSRIPTLSSREMSREGDAASGTGNVPDSTGLDVAISLRGKRLGSQTKNNGSREPESRCRSPKILPRSLSAPTVTAVENKIFGCEQKETRVLERTSSSGKTKFAENSLFKGTFLSLKDSFSLAKRTRNRKLGPPTQPNSCSELPAEVASPAEVTSPRQAPSQEACDSECERLVGQNDKSLLLSNHHWQTVSTKPQHDLRKKMGDAMERCLNGMLSDGILTPIDLHQWVTANDALDSSSESSMDKCEHSSPVSVLETPFHEESPSAVDQGDNVSKCSDIRDEPSVIQSECNQHFQDSGKANHHSRPIVNAPSAVGEHWLLCNHSDHHSESSYLCNAKCPPGKEDELKYIRDILLFSGFTNENPITVHAFLPNHGLNPMIFDELEQRYDDKEAKIYVLTTKDRQCSHTVSNRRLLFDAVDEILLEKLVTHVIRPWSSWLQPPSTRHQFTCTGKQLLHQTWSDILHQIIAPFETQDVSLDDLASRDLAKGPPWLHEYLDLEMLVGELERFILQTLVAEVVQDCNF